jgi:hypothetical protein
MLDFINKIVFYKNQLILSINFHFKYTLFNFSNTNSMILLLIFSCQFFYY